MRLPVLVVGLVLLADVSVAAAKACPSTSQPLLLIQRSKNQNEVRYDACLGPKGGLDHHRPVDDYWVIVKGGQRTREEIGSFEKKAYGYKVHHRGGGTYEFKMKAMKKRQLQLVSVGGHWKVKGSINGKDAFVERIYVTARESFPFPKVQQVDVYGREPRTGAKLHERILPKS